jgi:signal transduction histidine kinase
LDPASELILVVAPQGRDAEMIAAALRRSGLHARICGDVDAAASELPAAAVLLVTEEVLTRAALARLLEHLAAQPSWSDVPVVVLTRPGRTAEPDPGALQPLRRLGNVTLLERPVRVMTLISTVDSALRARRRQYEVRDHLARATAESRAKDEFLAMLGHELRNPLSAIAAASHLLDMMTGTDDHPSASAQRVIGRQVRHLTRLVDDLLDVSRVTQGKIQLAHQRLDVAVAVKNCVDALRAAGQLERHVVETALTSGWIDGDEVRLDQIINNLVVNAVKYTPAGGRIDVSVARENASVVIRVRDTGVGISAELLPQVFDLFVQEGRAIERKQGGLGIGLTLVRRLVELHGGVVTAHSDGPGQGSMFVVRLPAAPPPAASNGAATPSAAVAPPRRVLVVEDNDDARDIIAFMLKNAGHQVFQAPDGPSGLAIAIREAPDAAIIDIGLPDMSGYEIAARLRATAVGQAMLLVALTGYGGAQDRRRATEAGFDRFLVKPVDFDQLANALARAV